MENTRTFGFYFLLLPVLFSIQNCHQLEESNHKPFEQLTQMEGDETGLVFSPDGEKIAFSSDQGGISNVYIVEIKSGQVKKISTESTSDYRPNWSPEGTKLVYESKLNGSTSGTIYDIATNTHTNLIVDSINVLRPNWSNDGIHIAFMSDKNGNMDIWLYDLNQKAIRQITNFSGNEYLFGFSPDGKYIGYNERGKEEDLFAISIDGKEVINISQHKDHEWYPSWSPDGKQVLFYTTWGEEMTEVWVADFPSGKLTQISNHLGEDFGSIWSPDGTSVLFISNRLGHNELFLSSLKGGGPKSLNLTGILKKGWPLWSPKGNTIAFSTNQEEVYLYSIDTRGGSPKRVSQHAIQQEWPSISPDGQEIVFTSNGEGSEANILLLKAEDKLLSLKASYHYQTRPQWMPDGEQITYIQGPGGSVKTNDIWIMDKDGQNAKQVTHSGGVRRFIWVPQEESFIYAYDSSANYRYDIWKVSKDGENPTQLFASKGSSLPTSVHPDGKTFLFHSNFSGKNKIYSMSIHGGVYHEIENELKGGESAKYAPDGQQIVFLSNKNPEHTTDLYLMADKGGKVKRLTNSRAVEAQPSWHPNGNSIIYSANMGDKDIWLVHLDHLSNL